MLVSQSIKQTTNHLAINFDSLVYSLSVPGRPRNETLRRKRWNHFRYMFTCSRASWSPNRGTHNWALPNPNMMLLSGASKRAWGDHKRALPNPNMMRLSGASKWAWQIAHAEHTSHQAKGTRRQHISWQRLVGLIVWFIVFVDSLSVWLFDWLCFWLLDPLLVFVVSLFDGLIVCLFGGLCVLVFDCRFDWFVVALVVW